MRLADFVLRDLEASNRSPNANSFATTFEIILKRQESTNALKATSWDSSRQITPKPVKLTHALKQILSSG